MFEQKIAERPMPIGEKSEALIIFCELWADKIIPETVAKAESFRSIYYSYFYPSKFANGAVGVTTNALNF